MTSLRWRERLASGLLAVLLAACGGGGGGGGGSLPPIEYSGNTNAAVVSATNASTLVANVLGTSEVGQAIGGISVAAAEQAVPSGHDAISRRLSRTFADRVVQAERLSAAQGLASGVIPVDETEPCASGSVRTSGTVNDDGTGTLTVTFNQCRDGDVTLAGQASVRVDAFDMGAFLPTDFTISFARITLRGTGLSIDAGGSLRVQLNLAAKTETLYENIVSLDNLRGAMTKSENLVLVSVYDNVFFPTSISNTVTGRLFDSVHGFVEITTLAPLTFTSLAQISPQAGQLVLVGGNNRAVRATAQSVRVVVLALDLDGDGAFERSATLVWLDLARPSGGNLADSDGDGMHDSWETANDLDPGAADAAADKDGDGATNLEEYLACTNPGDPGSVPLPAPGPGPGPGPGTVSFSGLVVTLASNSDLAYDAGTQRLYAAVATNPGSVVPVDPTNAAMGTAITVGNAPVKLARSDDGQYLYVGLQGDPSVQRIVLSAQAVDLTIPLGSDAFFGAFYAEDIAVLPGSSQSIAVSLKVPGISPRHQGVAVFDNDVRRADVTPAHTGSNVIEFSASADTLYGYNNETTGFDFFRMAVNAGGVSVLDSHDSFNPAGALISGFNVDIAFHSGVIYATSGRAIDPVTRTVLGDFALPGFANAVVADVTVGRVFYLTGSGAATAIHAFDRNTHQSLAVVNVPGAAGDARSLVRWGAKGLAFRTTSGQVFITQQPELIP